MTDAQTEARAIETVRDWLNGGCSSWGLPSQQIETLLTALAAKDAELAVLRAELNDCASEIHELRAQLAEARKALEPFADAADDLEDDHKDTSSIWECPAAVNIDAGHLRAARRALTGGENG